MSTMITLVGIPLFGALFVPLAVGLVTVFLFWVLSSKNANIPSSVDELEKHDFNNTNSTQGKHQKKKKKGCGSKDDCCSKQEGTLGGCNTKSKAIGAVNIFFDQHSEVSQDLAHVLSKQLSSINMPFELINTSDSDLKILKKHADGSLCVFLIDYSVVNGHHQWLHQTIVGLPIKTKSLSDMKYTVFAVGSTVLFGKSKQDVEVDQWLHKSGAVRVSKAGIVDVSTSNVASLFNDWAGELLAQIQGWNAPKQKSCKCGPKKRNLSSDQEPDVSCNSSSNCSETDEDCESKEAASKRLLDLEDLAQILQK